MRVNGTHVPRRRRQFSCQKPRLSAARRRAKGQPLGRPTSSQRKHEHDDLKRKRQEQVSEVVDRTSELSEDVLKSLESGSRAAVEAVRKFVDVVDEALPALPHGERPSRRREIVDAAMDMADRLVKTQYEFLRNVMHSAGTTLSREEDEKWTPAARSARRQLEASQAPLSSTCRLVPPFPTNEHRVVAASVPAPNRSSSPVGRRCRPQAATNGTDLRSDGKLDRATGAVSGDCSAREGATISATRVSRAT